MGNSYKNPSTNVMDGTEGDLLWDTDDEAETDLLDTEWDPYDDTVNSESQDVLDDFLASVDDSADLNVLIRDFFYSIMV
jgi:hypothetical protein